jgi:hypothetical protein
MPEPSLNSNGCYIVTTEGVKLPIRRTVMVAIRKFMEQKLTGSVQINFRDGGIAAVEDRTVYPNS